ncbi:MAG: type II toxin-antitoxin system RelE/ParE family toxin [Desulfovibrionaceae bacterium]|nr:type II toxin-antitoxin system RelE/ParE family toxin [Desulfovibrionaceae bacterium]MBF0515231.1 type II toxin-antitoxin system RelE/ParE family toxin [Desulfovibrionaceae bacterium]
MTFHVFLTASAISDLRALVAYVALNDSPEAAETVAARIENALLHLETLPGRGHVPPEVDRIGVRNFREVHAGPYRITYWIREESVHVHCILDGRRDLQDLLFERLTRGV